MARLYEKVSYSAKLRMGFSSFEEISETYFGADALNIYTTKGASCSNSFYICRL